MELLYSNTEYGFCADVTGSDGRKQRHAVSCGVMALRLATGETLIVVTDHGPVSQELIGHLLKRVIEVLQVDGTQAVYLEYIPRERSWGLAYFHYDVETGELVEPRWRPVTDTDWALLGLTPADVLKAARR